MHAYMQGEELYLTVSQYPTMTGSAGIVQGGTTTISLSWLIRNIIREEIKAALAEQSEPQAGRE